jgi:hypothetical protein
MTDLVRTPLVAMLAVLGLGCSVLVDSERVQCSSDDDCSKRGGEFANSMCVSNLCMPIDPWSCADHAPLVAPSQTKVSIDFTMFDAVEMSPVSGARASLCGKLDLECKMPQATVTSDELGAILFEVPPLFDGYALITGEDKRGGDYDPTMMFLPPTLESQSLGAFPLTSQLATAGLAASLGTPIEPGTGRVLTTIVGCDRQTASGVSLAGENMGESAVRFYAVDGFPTFSATATDVSGFAGFVNVAPGSITLNAALEEDQHRVGRVALFVRPGHISIRRIQPWTD